MYYVILYYIILYYIMGPTSCMRSVDRSVVMRRIPLACPPPERIVPRSKLPVIMQDTRVLLATDISTDYSYSSFVPVRCLCLSVSTAMHRPCASLSTPLQTLNFVVMVARHLSSFFFLTCLPYPMNLFRFLWLSTFVMNDIVSIQWRKPQVAKLHDLS